MTLFALPFFRREPRRPDPPPTAGVSPGGAGRRPVGPGKLRDAAGHSEPVGAARSTPSINL